MAQQKRGTVEVLDVDMPTAVPVTSIVVGSLRVDASLADHRELLRWARRFSDRRWAIENASGLGCHLAQWLVARDMVPDIRSRDTALADIASRMSEALGSHDARLLEVDDVGPVLAVRLIDRAGLEVPER